MKANIILLKHIAIFLLLLTTTQIFAQSPKDNKILSVGDKMPDVVLTNIMNSRAKSFRLSDFKGKLVLVDFWATWCSTCIDAFPVLDSLQRIFPNKMKVLLVNPEKEHNSEKSVQMVIDRVNAWSTHRLKLPIVFQDTAITRYIIFHTVPTCAWIGPDGRLLAVTTDEEVTAANIERVINGDTVSLRSIDYYNKH